MHTIYTSLLEYRILLDIHVMESIIKVNKSIHVDHIYTFLLEFAIHIFISTRRLEELKLLDVCEVVLMTTAFLH